MLRLDPPLTRDVIVERDLQVPMPDGVVLLANRLAPKGGDGLPVALLRSPYGRGAMIATGMARPLAERGFQVIMQSVRGTSGSGGVFEPMRNERADGLATLEWIKRQPWFGGSIVLTGISYLGFVQWAMAGELPPEVKAMIPNNTDSALTLEFLRPDGLSLETPFGWGVMIDALSRPGALLRLATLPRGVARALRTIPLGDADVAAAGHRVDYIQDILAHDRDDPYWAPLDHRDEVAKVTIPVSSVGGWYDIFLPGQLRDFSVLRSLGRPARLTVGPWTHVSPDGTPLREAIEFGLAHARGEEPPSRAPVRLYVMGADTWRDFESWPPAGYPPTPFFLGANGTLAQEAPAGSGSDGYRYDPADPTPAVGGARMTMTRADGRAENTALEARPDVLTYTTSPLTADTEVVGEVSADIWFSSSLPSADVFVRLCDVDTQGRSWNICDGLTRLTSANELVKATVRLWPTAYRFKRGHRIRVQVSSGAFPRFARNPGTGEPHATATRLLPADQSVYHDLARASAITLPVRQVGAAREPAQPTSG
jgi:putative CocE/NonD family hydrolase